MRRSLRIRPQLGLRLLFSLRHRRAGLKVWLTEEANDPVGEMQSKLVSRLYTGPRLTCSTLVPDNQLQTLQYCKDFIASI